MPTRTESLILRIGLRRREPGSSAKPLNEPARSNAASSLLKGSVCFQGQRLYFRRVEHYQPKGDVGNLQRRLDRCRFLARNVDGLNQRFEPRYLHCDLILTGLHIRSVGPIFVGLTWFSLLEAYLSSGDSRAQRILGVDLQLASRLRRQPGYRRQRESSDSHQAAMVRLRTENGMAVPIAGQPPTNAASGGGQYALRFLSRE